MPACPHSLLAFSPLKERLQFSLGKDAWSPGPLSTPLTFQGSKIRQPCHIPLF